MTEPISLLPVRPSEIAVGAPLPQPVYDWHGTLLMDAGAVIESEKQREDILENGFFQDASWDLPLKSASVISSESDAKPKGGDAASQTPAAGKETSIDMDDVFWHVGETLYLQPHDQPNLRYAVQLIGFVKNKTVFVTAPMLDGKFELIRDGQTFVVRAFSGKKAYAFTAAAVKSIHSPHPYLLLSYPRQVLCTVVRQSARVDVKIIASISLGQPERIAAITLTDLSMGGTSAVTKDLLGKKGEEGRIKFKINAADFDSYLNVKVILRSVSRSENGDGFKHGFEFAEVSMHDRLILSAFVYQALVEIS